MAHSVKRFLAMFVLSWLAGAGLMIACFSQYAVDDFTLPDLIPVFSILVNAGSVEDEWFYDTATTLLDGRVFIAGTITAQWSPAGLVQAGVIL